MSDADEWNSILIPLTPSGRLPRHGPRSEVVSAIAEMMAPRRMMEPELISEVAIGQMLWDAIQEDQTRAWRNVIPHGERYIARASDEIVQALGTSDFAASLRASFIDRNLSRSVYATYLYYREGDWVPLHVDDWNIFEFSCLVCFGGEDHGLADEEVLRVLQWRPGD